MAKKRKGIPLGIVPPTGAMTPEQLANRLNQRAVRIPHKHRQDSVRDRNAA